MSKPIHVAIIDDGINREYLDDPASIVEYITFSIIQEQDTNESYVLIDTEAAPHSNSEALHGTKVYHTIRKYAPGTELVFHIFDVFCGKPGSSGALILEALDKILQEQIDIVVCSLTCDDSYRTDFAKYRGKFSEKQVLFLAAADNKNGESCPADLDFVYGVQGGLVDSIGKFNYDPNACFQFMVDTQFEIVGNGSRIMMFNGTSKATAVVAGRMAKMLVERGYTGVCEFLRQPHLEVANELNPYLKICAQCFGLPVEECVKKIDRRIEWTDDSIGVLYDIMKTIGREDLVYKMGQKELSSIRSILDFCGQSEQITHGDV